MKFIVKLNPQTICIDGITPKRYERYLIKAIAKVSRQHADIELELDYDYLRTLDQFEVVADDTDEDNMGDKAKTISEQIWQTMCDMSV